MGDITMSKENEVVEETAKVEDVTVEVKSTAVDPTAEIAKQFAEFKSASEAGNKDAKDTFEKAVTDIQAEIKSIRTAAARTTAADNIAEALETKSAEMSAFRDYLVTGDTVKYKTAVLNTTNAGEGDSVVPQSIQESIIALVQAETPMRSVATVVSGSQPKLIQPVQTGNAAAAWSSELAERTATNSASFADVEMTAHELYALPSCTLAFLEDSLGSVENFLVNTISEAFSIAENQGFTNGDGTANTPEGITHFIGATGSQGIKSVAAGDAAAITADELLKLQVEIPTAGRASGRYMMNSTTLFAAMTLKNGQGDYIFRPATQASSDGVLGTIWGRGVVENPEMADIGTGESPVLFGKLSDFYVYDRIGMTIVQDLVTTPSRKRWYVRKRVGSSVLTGQNLVALINA